MEKLNEQIKAQHIVEINLKIAHLRKKLGLNQIEFSQRAGIGLRFLRELEQGKISVRLDKLLQVISFLGCHLELKGNNEKMDNWLSTLTNINKSKADLSE